MGQGRSKGVPLLLPLLGSLRVHSLSFFTHFSLFLARLLAENWNCGTQGSTLASGVQLPAPVSYIPHSLALPFTAPHSQALTTLFRESRSLSEGSFPKESPPGSLDSLCCWVLSHLLGIARDPVHSPEEIQIRVAKISQAHLPVSILLRDRLWGVAILDESPVVRNRPTMLPILISFINSD